MKLKQFAVCLLSAAFLMGAAACGGPEEEKKTPTGDVWTVTSPDGALSVGAMLDYGQLSFEVKRGGVSVVEPSLLGISTSKNEFTALEFLEKKEAAHTYSYTNITGKQKEVTASFNELTLTFSETDFLLDVVFRAYDDGYAFRYSIRKEDGSEGTFDITDEYTHFRLPAGAGVYAMPYSSSGAGIVPGGDGQYFSYEGKYQYCSYKNIDTQICTFPVLYYTGDGDGRIYSLLTEADIYGRDYHGSYLQSDGNEGLKTIHALASGSEPSLEAAYPFTTPWRVGIVGDLAAIAESTLVEDVYDDVEPWKPDDYATLSDEEKETYEYGWVDPGCAVWSYLNYDTEELKHSTQRDYKGVQRSYADAAASLGFKWLVLDAGWNEGDYSENDLKDFIRYANGKGLHIMVWADVFSSFYTRAGTESRLAQWAEWGIEGVKIDFFDGQGVPYLSDKWKGESQQALDDLYEMFYQTAAKYRMIVDCHGSNKPTGERRKYPHVINREAIRGTEFKSVDAKQTVLLPFLRAAIGPSDFTPAIVPYISGTVTLGHNMGLAITLESGMPTFSDPYTHYSEGNYLDFYRNLPCVWDETRLVAADLSSYAVIARRSGDTWYIGCTATSAEKINFDLSFLGGGEHEAEIWRDGGNTSVVRKQQTVTSSSKMGIDVLKNGGFAMIIR